MVAIVGFMRFSVVTKSHKRGYKATRDKTVAEALATILEPARIENRLRLVETMPLPSLSAQTDPDFVLHMLISTELQPAYKARLYELAGGLRYLRIVEIGLHDDVQERVAALLVPGEPTVTFRLDDDDAVGVHHVEDLRRLAVPDNEGCFLSHPNGIYVQPVGDQLFVQEVTNLHNAFGIGYLSSKGETVFHAGAHNQAGVGVAVSERPRAWARSIHSASDSGEEFMRGAPAVALRPELFPEFAFIDFEKLRANLAPLAQDGVLKRIVKLGRISSLGTALRIFGRRH
jgi:hypothetical protein